MKTEGHAMILPPGSMPRIVLSGDVQTIKIVGYSGWEAWVEYPDGYRRHHQAFEVIGLLAKIDGQLRMRYNIDEFSFKAIPQALSVGETITIGEIKYA